MLEHAGTHKENAHTRTQHTHTEQASTTPQTAHCLCVPLAGGASGFVFSFFKKSFSEGVIAIWENGAETAECKCASKAISVLGKTAASRGAAAGSMQLTDTLHTLIHTVHLQ